MFKTVILKTHKKKKLNITFLCSWQKIKLRILILRKHTLQHTHVIDLPATSPRGAPWIAVNRQLQGTVLHLIRIGSCEVDIYKITRNVTMSNEDVVRISMWSPSRAHLLLYSTLHRTGCVYWYPSDTWKLPILEKTKPQNAEQKPSQSFAFWRTMPNIQLSSS